jgi:Cofilin/tropomyosin-type actin-binding protein
MFILDKDGPINYQIINNRNIKKSKTMHQAIDFDPAVIETFNGIKMKGAASYMILKIDDDFKVVIEQLGEVGASWDSMCDSLPEDDGRYVVFDYKKKFDDGRTVSRLIFLYWCPDGVKI